MFSTCHPSEFSFDNISLLRPADKNAWHNLCDQMTQRSRLDGSNSWLLGYWVLNNLSTGRDYRFFFGTNSIGRLARD